MRRILAAGARPALLFAGLGVAGLLLRSTDLGDALRRPWTGGAPLFAVLASVACAIGVPRQVVAYAGGLAFGFWPGTALALLAETVGCVLDFWWARLLGRRWATRRLAGGGRLARLDAFLRANAFRATLTLRLLPLGSNIALNLLAGVSGVAAMPFVLASAVGYVPQTVVFALLGGGVRVTQGAQVGLAAGLMAVSIALGILLLRRRLVPS